MLIFSYIACEGNIKDKAAFAETMKKVLPKAAEEEVMTIVEMYRQEGIQKGIEQEKLEVAKGLVNEGLADEVIIKVTGLSFAKLSELKKQVLH